MCSGAVCVKLACLDSLSTSVSALCPSCLQELARLLQDQEHKRGGQLDRDKMKAIEAQDEELAIVIQEQEKLRQQRRQQRIEAKRQMSQPVYTNQV